MIVVFCGGVGGSRFLRALTSVVQPERVTAIVNTGDDDWFHGLYVSPDPDIITYALAGEVDEERGWGLQGDTFRWLESLKRFGGAGAHRHETWFQIGDRDLATHLHRTRLLREGRTLSSVTDEIARAFGVGVRILPMSDDRVRTIVATPDGDLSFQEYLVKRHAQDRVVGVRFEGASDATPTPGVLDALRDAEAIFIAPSNPIASIGPILAVPGVREALHDAKAARVAVCPIVGGRSLQPPAGEMMSGMGYPVAPSGVVRVYEGLIDALIIDEADADDAETIVASGVRAIVAETVMRDEASRRALGMVALEAGGIDT